MGRDILFRAWPLLTNAHNFIRLHCAGRSTVKDRCTVQLVDRYNHAVIGSNILPLILSLFILRIQMIKKLKIACNLSGFPGTY